MKIKSILLFIVYTNKFIGYKDSASKKDNNLEEIPKQSENIKNTEENVLSVEFKVLFSKDDVLEVFLS